MKVDTPTQFLRFMTIIILVACVIIHASLAIGFTWTNSLEESKRKERYPDWVKLTGRTDISYEEFRRLDRAGYLKGTRK